ncbi:two-component transcriptional regulator, LuxR family [Calothrix sp. PCC 7716]|nr:two-component transcriptional regulator, LuxR family [Calothrix sp. PCC 7716]
MIKLLLVDDQALFLQGLTDLLLAEPDFEVVGQAQDGQIAIELAQTLQPDVILMDVRMPQTDGVVATRQIHQRYPWIRILVLTTFENDEYVYQSLQAGALGYLLKRTPSEQIAAAIRSVNQGYSQLGPTIAPKVFAQLKPTVTPSSEPECLTHLSRRQLEVLRLVGQGKNNQEIARTLYITEGTVKGYINQILRELGVRDRIQAVLWAQQYLIK